MNLQSIAREDEKEGYEHALVLAPITHAEVQYGAGEIVLLPTRDLDYHAGFNRVKRTSQSPAQSPDVVGEEQDTQDEFVKVDEEKEIEDNLPTETTTPPAGTNRKIKRKPSVFRKN